MQQSRVNNREFLFRSACLPFYLLSSCGSRRSYFLPEMKLPRFRAESNSSRKTKRGSSSRSTFSFANSDLSIHPAEVHSLFPSDRASSESEPVEPELADSARCSGKVYFPAEYCPEFPAL